MPVRRCGGLSWIAQISVPPLRMVSCAQAARRRQQQRRRGEAGHDAAAGRKPTLERYAACSIVILLRSRQLSHPRPDDRRSDVRHQSRTASAPPMYTAQRRKGSACESGSRTADRSATADRRSTSSVRHRPARAVTDGAALRSILRIGMLGVLEQHVDRARSRRSCRDT